MTEHPEQDDAPADETQDAEEPGSLADTEPDLDSFFGSDDFGGDRFPPPDDD